MVRDGNGTERFVPGPNAEAGTPGGIIAYDDTDPEQAIFAEQFTRTPGWFEVDKDGNPVFPEPEKSEEPPAEEAAETSAPAEAATTDEPAPAG